MNNVPKSCSLLVLAALAPITLMLLSTNLCAQPAKGGAASVVRRVQPQDEKERMNAWTVGLAGGLLGLGLAMLGLWAVRQQPVGYADLAHLDPTMLITTFVLAIASSIIAGLVPAWHACQVTPAVQLKSQ